MHSPSLGLSLTRNPAIGFQTPRSCSNQHPFDRLAGGGGAEDQRVAVGECPQALDRAAGADPDLEQAVLLPNRDLEVRENPSAASEFSV